MSKLQLNYIVTWAKGADTIEAHGKQLLARAITTIQAWTDRTVQGVAL